MDDANSSDLACSSLPRHLSSFVDAFIDFSVSGLFFPSPSPSPRTNAPPTLHLPLSTHFPAPSRLVAIGDLHGDLPKSLQALALAGLVDPFSLRWTGGSTVAVQIGDVLDRGSEEIRLLYLLHRIKLESARAGGALLTIHGNHEVMNIEGDFRYVTPGGLQEFKQWGRWFCVGLSMKRLCPGLEIPSRDPFKGIPTSFPGVKREFWEGFRARIAALRPAGILSRRFLSDNQAVVVVGDSVFIHGGLLERHVEYGFERINKEARDWIMGLNGRFSPWYLRGRDSVVWLRRFSDGFNCDCRHLEAVLSMIPGVRRMIMGHTIQAEGINAVCEDRAIRIDVGLSKGCSNGLPEVLEISGGLDLRVITANTLYDGRKTVPLAREEEKEGLALLLTNSRMNEVRSAA
ncbi:hypothetical protein KSP39_PZI016093 [Platanthera zijinensis]|uniref:Calcineurin-like phosphoesterase domain-containing protein n=1 Tax=Platanthera zijinensis TaxID=2320716 RepID=A0AAP0G0J9_9ASPA